MVPVPLSHATDRRIARRRQTDSGDPSILEIVFKWWRMDMPLVFPAGVIYCPRPGWMLMARREAGECGTRHGPGIPSRCFEIPLVDTCSLILQFFFIEQILFLSSFWIISRVINRTDQERILCCIYSTVGIEFLGRKLLALPSIWNH